MSTSSYSGSNTPRNFQAESTSPEEHPIQIRELHDFHGGIHPADNKHQSTKTPIRDLPLPEHLILPLNQHLGAPAEVCVQVGQKVLKGETVAKGNGPVSVGVHAPTSGIVTDINDYSIPHPSGLSAPCIVIKPDGSDQWIEHQGNDDFYQQTPGRLLECIRTAGIAGLGGAGFPTATKLQAQQKINTLIINAAECEPYITADDMLMREHARDIITGIEIVAHILGTPQSIIIGIEDNKPEAYQALSQELKNKAPSDQLIELVEIPTKYPSGGEKQLIRILTGEEVPSGKLPAELGIVCINVSTAFAIKQAVCEGIPLISRITTVTGKTCAQPGNYRVLLGTPVTHLLTEAGFDPSQCTRLVIGGPMMGFSLTDTEAPLVKTSNCLLAADASEFPANDFAQACIRCGLCAEVCPASLLPQQLYWYARSQNHQRLQAHNLFDCIECGACSYVCPSNIPLVQYYRAAKGEIRQQEKEKIASDRARQRFEAHQQRLAREEQEKAARREARRQAALARQNEQETPAADSSSKATDPGSDLVKAAMARLQVNSDRPEKQQQKLTRALSAAQSKLERRQAQFNETTPESAQRNTLLADIERARLQCEDIKQRLEKLKENKTVTSQNGDSKEASPVQTELQRQTGRENGK